MTSEAHKAGYGLDGAVARPMLTGRPASCDLPWLGGNTGRNRDCDRNRRGAQSSLGTRQRGTMMLPLPHR